MPNLSRTLKLTCLFFGEGKKDNKFILALKGCRNFQYHTRKWVIQNDCHHGEQPRQVLENCRKRANEADFDLVICLVDTDILQEKHGADWVSEKEKLEREFCEINIIWQVPNAEEEYRKALKIKKKMSKHKLNKYAIKNIDSFVGSEFYNKIKICFKNYELRHVT